MSKQVQVYILGAVVVLACVGAYVAHVMFN